MDVDAEGGAGKGDMQESFLFAEVLKYLFLILNEKGGPLGISERGPETWVFNTEAQ